MFRIFSFPDEVSGIVGKLDGTLLIACGASKTCRYGSLRSCEGAHFHEEGGLVPVVYERLPF